MHYQSEKETHRYLNQPALRSVPSGEHGGTLSQPAAKAERLPRCMLCAVAVLALAAMAAPRLAGAVTDDPYEMPDDTWIEIGGTVHSVALDSFTLDYGDGMVLVEMDDGDRDADGYKLVKGDRVLVSGVIDDDFFETTSIEAESVYVESLGTTFFASSIDEEDRAALTAIVASPVEIAQTTVRGIVTEVDEESFVINTGPREVTVDVSEMAYDPLDSRGYQRVLVGDYVKVTGRMDDGFFTGRELAARSIVKLYQGSATAGSS